MGLMHLYFNPSGRINRSTFWLKGVLLLHVIWLLITLGYIFIIVVNTANIDISDLLDPGYILSSISLYVIVFVLLYAVYQWNNFAVSVKRLHDRDKSAWWILLWWAIFVIGGAITFGIASIAVLIWVFIELGCLEGTQGRNRYGYPPDQPMRYQSARTPQVQPSYTKACPNCGNRIRSTAVRCGRCGSDIAAGEGVNAQTHVAQTHVAQTRTASRPVSPPAITNVSGGGATAVGVPGSPVAAAVPTPAQTMAMQPDVASSMAWLVVTRGPSEGKSVQLKEGNNTIGRSLENDLQIDDASVSRSHAMLSVRDDRFTLVDLGSAGGTRIGDHRISGKRIGAGSAIIVGQTRLNLVSVDAFQGGPSSGATMVGSPSGSSLSLMARSGPDAGKSFLLASAQNVIGRDSSAQVILSDPTVSRRHAMLRVDADRTTISDLGSQSGTQVDGEMVTGVDISVGDRVVIGQSEFTLMRPGS